MMEMWNELEEDEMKKKIGGGRWEEENYKDV